MDQIFALTARDDPQHPTLDSPMHFSTDYDRRGSIICASVIAGFLAVLSTVLRYMARRKVAADLGADDYWIFFGCFMAVNVVMTTFATVRWGLGLHIEAVTNPEALGRSVLASQVVYASSVVPIKISILYFYNRIFPAPGLRKLSIAIGSIVVLYSVVQIICMLTQCIPQSAIWDKSVTGSCFDINAVYTVMAVLNVSTDVIILCLPIKYVWALEMAKPRKVQILGVFLLGSCVCAFSIVRAAVVGTASNTDQSWNDISSSIWSEVEICVGVVSANLPCLRPLLRRLPKNLGGSSSEKPSQGNTNRMSRAIELSRRPKSGFHGAGWENIDESDSGPLVVASHVRRPSPTRSKRVSKATMGRGEPFEGAIVVETTIETTYDDAGGDDSSNSSKTLK